MSLTRRRMLACLPGVLLLITGFGCGSQDGERQVPKASVGSLGGTERASNKPDDANPVSAVQLQADEANGESPASTIVNLFPEILVSTSLGDIRIRLNGEKAPQTVANFLKNYVDRGFYDSTLIHYVDAGFMVSGGGYSADFEAKPVRTEIRHEGENGLKNKRGTIAMVRHAEYIHSATSQFFINLADNPSLDYQETEESEETEETEGKLREPSTYGYCVFGEIVEGLDVLEKIGASPVIDKPDFPRTPTDPVVIKKIERIP